MDKINGEGAIKKPEEFYQEVRILKTDKHVFLTGGERRTAVPTTIWIVGVGLRGRCRKNGRVIVSKGL